MIAHKTAHVLLISGDVLKDPTKPISGNPFLPYEKPTGPGNIRWCKISIDNKIIFKAK